MVFSEGDDYRALRRPGDDPAQFRSPVRFGAVPSSAVVDGLVAWYRFADNSNTAIDYTAELDDDRFADTTAFDGTVNGASFQPSGGVRDVVSGPNSGAYEFDGVDDHISVTGSGLDVTSPPWTITLALRRLDTSDSNGFVSQAENGNFKTGQFQLRFDPKFNFDIGGVNNKDIGPQITDSNFHLIGVSCDTNGTFQGMVDGNFTQTATVAVPSNVATDSLSFGRNHDRFSNLVIDDGRFYNRQLTEPEFNQIFTNII
jgi:hypothetical protein